MDTSRSKEGKNEFLFHKAFPHYKMIVTSHKTFFLWLLKWPTHIVATSRFLFRLLWPQVEPWVSISVRPNMAALASLAPLQSFISHKSQENTSNHLHICSSTFVSFPSFSFFCSDFFLFLCFSSCNKYYNLFHIILEKKATKERYIAS